MPTKNTSSMIIPYQIPQTTNMESIGWYAYIANGTDNPQSFIVPENEHDGLSNDDRMRWWISGRKSFESACKTAQLNATQIDSIKAKYNL